MKVSTLMALAERAAEVVPQDLIRKASALMDEVTAIVEDVNDFVDEAWNASVDKEDNVWDSATDNVQAAPQEPAPTQSGGSVNDIISSIYDYLKDNNLLGTMEWSGYDKDFVVMNYKYALTNRFLRHINNDVIGK